MFAQFRSQYPQGRIQTEMLSKIDGLHAFRAIVSQGDAIMGTATAVDADLEIAEDRAIKRAIAIAGISFDNALSSAFDHSFGNYGSPMLAQREPINSLPPSAQITHTIQSEPAFDYGNEYEPTEYIPEQIIPEEIIPEATPIKASAPQIAPEPVDLSEAISKIDVEMERLSWTKPQGRDYLVRTFDKKARSQLTNDELLQFLSHLKSLPTPHRQASGDDFF